jgi:RNA polymerase sigma-70 factor (ECF subfamily)
MPSPMISSAEFELERSHLLAVAHRMLGSRAEAEDAVQEAWLRFAKTRQDGTDIRDPRGWLTTVTGRICLDVLKSARVSREAYPTQWLPSFFVDPDPGPAGRAELSDEVGLALLVVLERLTPEQRVAVVLHDAFDVPFDGVASVLGTTAAAARQHASRGRKAVAEGTPRHTADLAEQRRALHAFLAAANSGDLHALAAVLAPDVVSISDGGTVVSAGTRPVVGADKVARLYLGLIRGRIGDGAALRMDEVLVNGSVGVLVRGRFMDGKPLLSVLVPTVADGQITGLFNQLNPDKILLSDLL